MQVVLWKPPGHFVHQLISTDTTSCSELSPQQQRRHDDDDDDVMTDDDADTQQQHVTSLTTAADNDMDL